MTQAVSEILTFSGEKTERHKVEVQVLKLTKNLYVYRRQDISEIISETGMKQSRNPEPRTVEHIINTRNLRNMTTGKTYNVLQFQIYSKRLKEYIRQHGYHDTIKNLSKQNDLIRYDVFTAFSQGEATLDDLVMNNFSGYYFSDYNGNALPQALICDYMNGHFDDAHYNLDKAAAHLLTRPDILVQKHQMSHHEEYKWQPAKDVNEAITAIPFYNRHSTKYSQIVFRWMPSAADYAKVIDPKRVWDTTAIFKKIFELDLFGLRAAGAALYNSYYDERKNLHE